MKAGRPYAPPSKFNDFDQGVTTDPTESDKFIQELWQSYHVEGCPEAQETGMEYKCGTVHVAYHFIKTPVYIMVRLFCCFCFCFCVLYFKFFMSFFFLLNLI